MENLQSILTRAVSLASTSELLSEQDYEQARVDIANAIVGELHKQDGYRCERCRNRGYIVKLRELPNGHFTQASCECRCMDIRRTLRRMQRSGLKSVLDTCTFDRYEAGGGLAAARIQAARSTLEYALKLTEQADILAQLRELEQWRKEQDGQR